MERLNSLTNVCLSGGASGADFEWGRCAKAIGQDLVHWSFPGHRSPATESELVRLTDDQLSLADDALENAARALGKSLPRKSHVVRLLKRNYYQVARSESCYAVTVLNAEPGGTTWAMTMFSQLHPGNRNLYVYDMAESAWFQSTGKGWDRIDGPPRPRGIWAGIGSRQLDQNGADAIRKLMGCELTDPKN